MSGMPSVNDGTISVFGFVSSTPRRRARLYGSQSPVSVSSLAKKVFTEPWVPV